MFRSLSALLASVMLALPAQAATYSLTYSGTVDTLTDLPGGVALPEGIEIGDIVTGRVSFDTDMASGVTRYPLCANSVIIHMPCMTGSYQNGRYDLGSTLVHEVSIGDHHWSGSPGSVWLVQGNLMGGYQFISFGQSEIEGLDADVRVEFGARYGLATLFSTIPDELSTVNLLFANALEGVGGISLGDDSYSITFVTGTPTAVPAPASVLLLATGISGLIAARRRRRSAST